MNPRTLKSDARNDGVVPHVLIVRRRYLGDVLLLSRVVAALRQAQPPLRVSLLVERRYADAAWLLPGVEDVSVFPERLWQWPPFIASLRRKRFTHLMDYDNRPRTAAVAAFIGAKHRYACAIGRTKRVWPGIYHWFRIMPQEVYFNQHVSELYAWPLIQTGLVREIERTHQLDVPEEDRKWAKTLLEEHGLSGVGPLLLIHPGTRSEARRWPAERFAEVVRRLRSRFVTLRVGLICGPGDAQAVAAIRAVHGSELPVLPGDQGAARLAALLSRADVFLGHDSGPAHLAAGVGPAVVTISNADNLEQWRPWTERARVLMAPKPCTQCLMPDMCVRGDGYRTYCVRHIGTGEVESAVAGFIDQVRVMVTEGTGR